MKAGNPLLVFPEGTRSRDGNLSDAKKGIGLLIKKAKCDVLPVYIDGSFEILGRGKFFPRLGKKLKIYYGEIITYKSLAERSDLSHQEISDFVLGEIGRLKQ